MTFNNLPFYILPYQTELELRKNSTHESPLPQLRLLIDEQQNDHNNEYFSTKYLNIWSVNFCRFLVMTNFYKCSEINRVKHSSVTRFVTAQKINLKTDSTKFNTRDRSKACQESVTLTSIRHYKLPGGLISILSFVCETLQQIKREETHWKLWLLSHKKMCLFALLFPPPRATQHLQFPPSPLSQGFHSFRCYYFFKMKILLRFSRYKITTPHAVWLFLFLFFKQCVTSLFTKLTDNTVCKNLRSCKKKQNFAEALFFSTIFLHHRIIIFSHIILNRNRWESFSYFSRHVSSFNFLFISTTSPISQQ